VIENVLTARKRVEDTDGDDEARPGNRFELGTLSASFSTLRWVVGRRVGHPRFLIYPT